MPVAGVYEYLTDAVNSVKAQTYRNWELLLVVDRISPDAVAMADGLAATDARIRLVHVPSGAGAARARNAGIAESRGRFIAFLDADDIWLPEKLETQLRAIAASGAAIVHSSYFRIDAAGRRIGLVPTRPRLSLRDLCRGHSIGCLTALLDTRRVGEVRMPEYALRQDLALWLRLLRNYGDSVGVLDPLAEYRVHSQSLSSNKLRAAFSTWRVHRDFAPSVSASVRAFVWYAVRGLWNRFRYPHALRQAVGHQFRNDPRTRVVNR